jgi:pimeloyl-ACP methyl ester carboxylesterase
VTRTACAVTVLALVTVAGCGPGQVGAAPTSGPAVARTSVATASPSATPAAVSPSAKPAAKPDGVTPGAGLARFYAARAVWRACTRTSGAADFLDLQGYQCAMVRVPLDYRHPAGRTINVGIARLPASGSHRIGSLVINPGGPGASGLAYLTVATSAIPAAVRARFDIVGFDPRGVGVSAGLHCLPTAQLDALQAADPIPRTPAQIRAAVARAAKLAAGCRSTAGWELPFLGTAYSARDLDLIRSAVGDSRLTYLGKSYGTLLGAVYADEFPRRVRALVLDGALPPGLDPAVQSREQGAGFEGDLRDFLADCVSRPDCPWPGTAARARTKLNALLAGVAASSLPTGTGRLLHAGEAVNGLSAALYSTGRWSLLRAALSQAQSGDGTVLLELSDSLSGRHTGGYDTELSAFPAIGCADVPATYTAAQAAAFARQWAKASPLYGPLEAWGLVTCNGWVRTASALPARVTARGAAPIVVVGTTGDPATPYSWARDLAGQLASARLVTYLGDGHTVYGSGRSACVDAALNAYLIARVVPAAGLRCAG